MKFVIVQTPYFYPGPTWETTAWVFYKRDFDSNSVTCYGVRQPKFKTETYFNKPVLYCRRDDFTIKMVSDKQLSSVETDFTQFTRNRPEVKGLFHWPVLSWENQPDAYPKNLFSWTKLEDAAHFSFPQNYLDLGWSYTAGFTLGIAIFFHLQELTKCEKTFGVKNLNPIFSHYYAEVKKDWLTYLTAKSNFKNLLNNASNEGRGVRAISEYINETLKTETRSYVYETRWPKYEAFHGYDFENKQETHSIFREQHIQSVENMNRYIQNNVSWAATDNIYTQPSLPIYTLYGFHCCQVDNSIWELKTKSNRLKHYVTPEHKELIEKLLNTTEPLTQPQKVELAKINKGFKSSETPEDLGKVTLEEGSTFWSSLDNVQRTFFNNIVTYGVIYTPTNNKQVPSNFIAPESINSGTYQFSIQPQLNTTPNFEVLPDLRLPDSNSEIFNTFQSYDRKELLLRRFIQFESLKKVEQYRLTRTESLLKNIISFEKEHLKISKDGKHRQMSFVRSCEKFLNHVNRHKHKWPWYDNISTDERVAETSLFGFTILKPGDSLYQLPQKSSYSKFITHPHETEVLLIVLSGGHLIPTNARIIDRINAKRQSLNLPLFQYRPTHRVPTIWSSLDEDERAFFHRLITNNTIYLKNPQTPDAAQFAELVANEPEVNNIRKVSSESDESYRKMFDNESFCKF